MRAHMSSILRALKERRVRRVRRAVRAAARRRGAGGDVPRAARAGARAAGRDHAVCWFRSDLRKIGACSIRLTRSASSKRRCSPRQEPLSATELKRLFEGELGVDAIRKLLAELARGVAGPRRRAGQPLERLALPDPRRIPALPGAPVPGDAAALFARGHGDAGHHRLPPAGHARRHRGRARRRRVDPDHPGARDPRLDRRRRPPRNPWPAGALRHHEQVPRRPRAALAGRAAAARGDRQDPPARGRAHCRSRASEKNPSNSPPPAPTAERLQKLLAAAGLGSRREIETWIEAGRVAVNGKVAKLGDRAALRDSVAVDGKPVTQPEKRSRASCCTTSRSASWSPATTRRAGARSSRACRRAAGLQSAGSTSTAPGLLLLTDSGELANRLMHPRYEIEREYHARVRGELTRQERERLLAGVALDDGPARFDRIEELKPGEGSNRWYRVVLREGRNREVRRLFEALGHPVSRLSRVRYGPVELPRDLASGKVARAPRKNGKRVVPSGRYC